MSVTYEPPRLETCNGGMSGRALFQSLVGKGGFFGSHSRQHVGRIHILVFLNFTHEMIWSGATAQDVAIAAHS